MVSEVIEASTETQVDQSQTETQTETTETAETAVEERAAETQTEDAAKAPQVEAVAEKPLTQADLDRMFDERESKIREDERLREQRRRQTENARKANQEKRETEERQEAVDTVRATFAAQGIDPAAISDDLVTKAIDRLARKKADGLGITANERVGEVWDAITAQAYGKEPADLTPESLGLAEYLVPRVQNLVNQLRPMWEQKSREGWIAESDLPKRVDAEIARRNAKSREGQEELKRPGGAPPTADTNSLSAWETRVAHQGEDGYPMLSDADWTQYRAVRTANGL